jgi:excisionase family DNA binding protein
MEFLTPDDVARVLKVKKCTVYALIRKGLPVIKTSKKLIRIRKEDLETWLEGKKGKDIMEVKEKRGSFRKGFVDEIIKSAKREVLLSD